MSQANPKYSEFEIAPKRDRQSPEPLKNLPVYDLTDEVDPSKEIRTLIIELQAVARDSRLQMMGIEHQRDDAVRQLNEALRQQEESERRTQEIAAKIADMQKQVLSIRQARDAAQAQNLAVTNRLLRAEDEIAELGYEREAALKVAEESADKASSLCDQLEAVTRDRDAAIKEAGDLRSELEEERRKFLDLEKQHSATSEANHEQATALLEARAEIVALTEKHEAECAHAREQAEVASQQIGELRTRATEITDIASELAEIRSQLAVAIEERELRILHAEETLLPTVLRNEQQPGSITDPLVADQLERKEALQKAERIANRRLQSLDLASELEATWRDVLETCAVLQVKLAQKSCPL